jgi:hypothetical protein
MSEEDDRRLPRIAQGKQGPEIGVRREDDAVFGLRQSEEHFVLSSGQPSIPHMNGIVAFLA